MNPQLSKLEYYAGQVLLGELSSQSEGNGHWMPGQEKALAIHCFTVAKAMVDESQKHAPTTAEVVEKLTT